MRWWIAALSLVCCLMPWRASLAHYHIDHVTDEDARAVLDERVSGGMVQRMCYNPRHFIRQATGQILGYGSDTKISLAQIEIAVEAELARLRAKEMRWLLEADLDSNLIISADERDVLVHAASALMRDRLFRLHQLADTDGDASVSLAELQFYAARKAEEILTPEARAGLRAVTAFDLNDDGWTALNEVMRSVDLLCGAV